MFAFRDGKAFFANRFVRTKGFVEEQQAGRLLYRGAFSVGNPTGGFFYNPFDFSIKGVANTGVVHWGDKVLALHERDLPYELSTPGLETVGQTVEVPTEHHPYFAAHYRVTQEPDGSRRLVAFNSSERSWRGLGCCLVRAWIRRGWRARWRQPCAEFCFANICPAVQHWSGRQQVLITTMRLGRCAFCAGEAMQDNTVTVWEYDEQMHLLLKTESTLPGAAFGFFHGAPLISLPHFLPLPLGPWLVAVWGDALLPTAG